MNQKCVCGTEAREVVMATFSYWFCPSCKEDIEHVKKTKPVLEDPPTFGDPPDLKQEQLDLLDEFEKLVANKDAEELFNTGPQGADLNVRYYYDENTNQFVKGGIER